MNYTEKVIRQSNYWYNSGLQCANIRDLSGAILALKRSLQYCQHNIAARNLLGLVYYGRGEINEALVEWIISKNLKPRENVANYFIRRMQETPNELDGYNYNIKKYNQCLVYCQNGAEDLAYIQLKKVVSACPDFVKALQLTALLSIQYEHYGRARQLLKRAQKLDSTDALTLYYLNELEERKGRKTKEDKEDVVTYQVGNETVIQPSSTHIKEYPMQTTILNLLIGGVFGAAAILLLVLPTLQQGEAHENADAIRAYSQQVESQNAQINALQSELEPYRLEESKAEADVILADDIKADYEELIKIEMDFDPDLTTDLKGLAERLGTINEDYLGETALALYEEMESLIVIPFCESSLESANENIADTDLNTAATHLENIMLIRPDYNSYGAMKLLADTYVDLELIDQAKEYYNQILTEYADTELANEVTDILSEL